MSREQGFVASIGRPIANTQIYLLDGHGQPVPIGVVGEIYIGGAGVARGYLNRPELTAERFVKDPFQADPRARMYRSGDLGRWRADGTIEYLGRNDHQVKIRGYRIELGEIEAELRMHAQVRAAVVLAREGAPDAPGEKRLVAYVTPREKDAALSVEELRDQLKGTLPEYMVPSAFVVLESLPLTANGKLDRRALPAPDQDSYARQEYEAPQGELEVALAGIWQELLRVERVGRQDNFFELGGHSLLVVQMIERLRRRGWSAQARAVFESVSLAGLASGLTQQNEVLEPTVPANLIPAGCERITPQMLPLVQLQEEQIQRIVQGVPGEAGNIQDIYPLAPLQEGILFHYLLNEGGGDTYILPTLLQLSSRARLEELIEALQKVIERHDILRSAVQWEGLPQPVQVVWRRAPLPVQEVVLEADRDAVEQLKERMRPERQRMDLRQAPLLRLQVAADPDAERWYGLLQLHHLVGDHGSLEIVVEEVLAHLQGQEGELAEAVAYRGHVAQALWHAGRQDAQEFFRSKLAQISESTAPFGLMDVHGDGSQIEEGREELSAELSQRVRKQARKRGVSSATLFHAAWGLVVARTSARDDVVYGSVLSGRLQGSAGAQRILGMFINTLPLRLQLGRKAVEELVEQTQRELVELLRYEQVSLSRAQSYSGIEGTVPLFTALLNYRHSAPNRQASYSSAKQLSESGIQLLSAQERTNYPIAMSVDDLGEGFRLTAQTDRRIDPHRVTSYLRTAIQAMVEALESAPQTPVLMLSILPEAERRQVLELFNATWAHYPQEKLIHELFEKQVERTPEAIAVVYEGVQLTYAQLNARANQLARYLRDQGVEPDQLVGICVERSLEMVLGLLGILKAGGAYVPLDPSYPAERLAYMLRDAAPKVLLTQERLRETVPQSGAEVIALDGDWSEIAQQPVSNLDGRTLGQHSRQLAYVIYTSGSTGEPKGVMVEHRSVCNLFAAQAVFEVGTSSRILQFASISFDASVFEMVMALCRGASLHVVRPELVLTGEELVRVVSERQVTHLTLTPSVLATIPEQADLSSIQTLITAGEALSRSQVERASVGRRLFNAYGPTEATVWASLHPCSVGEVDVPIGRPISNTQIYILDGERQPLPIGVVGEIYIGGAGVARGYLKRPELTAERFVKDPFQADHPARMYRTGDLGRWRADGTIEYLGRNDSQVKIRGYRIELGEIEAQLVLHALVSEAVVLAREDAPGEKRLVAYVIPQEKDATLSVEELRNQLKGALPEYMVPSAFVVLESLPLTANGKLDRRALPAPDQDSYARQEYEAPQGELEIALAGIWQELLRVERVGRQDNFFELGGHSLLAVQVVVRVADRFAVRISVRDLLSAPTLQRLALCISRELDELNQYQSVIRNFSVSTDGIDTIEEIEL